MAWYHRFHNLFRREKLDRRIDDELAFHVTERVDELTAQGMSEKEALRRARRQFGNYTRQKEKTREADLLGWLETIAQDVRYGFRTLAANPGFTATAVLSLMLGIGANTAIFTVLNALLLRSLPVEDPQALAQITPGAFGDDEFTNPIWQQVRDHQQAFSGVLAYSPARFDLAAGGESHFAEGLWVSGDFFRVLGVPALQGRVFTKDDDQYRGGPAGPVAVISYSFWKRNFPDDAHVIGKTVRLERHQFEIVGVTPPWFTGLDVDKSFDVAIPIGYEPILHPDHSMFNERLGWWLRILGRLPAGETVQRAQDRMRALAPAVYRATVPQDFEADSQKQYLTNTFFLRPAATGFSGTGNKYRTALFTLMGIAGLVLLIACANIANLLLARGSARQREFSVRMSIGAARSRVIRQLMTESLLLAVLGAAGGFLIAMWGSRLLVRLLPAARDPLEINLSPDPHLLAFTIGAAVLTALLFGLAPAFRATRIELNQVLKESASAGVKGSSRFNLGKALVAGQVAVSLVLLVGAGLFLGTLRNLLAVNPGFDSHDVLIVNANVQHVASGKEQVIRSHSEILDRLQALPDVASAASSALTPMSGRGWNGRAEAEGFVPESPHDSMVFLNRVSPGYFKTLKTPLLAGRDFSDRDNASAPPAMVINESAARHFFGAENPIGKTISTDERDASNAKKIYHVIGVTKDAKYFQLEENPVRTAYLAAGQDPDPDPTRYYEVRSRGPLDALTPSIRTAIAQVNRGISLEFRSFDAQVGESLLQPRMVALLSSLFGALALMLAMVGLYGVTNYAVARRRGEIGIRIALGATGRSVIWLMLQDVAVLLAVGVLVGLAASLAAGRLIHSLLYGLRPNDPLHLTGAAFILVVAAALAAYLPARRAARLDPMTALRDE